MASVAKRPNGRWRARYRDAAGQEHSRHFTTKREGQRWLDEVTADVLTGRYVDPGAGRATFATFYKAWSARQVWVHGTRVSVDHTVSTVTFADVPLRSIRRSHVEQWVKAMTVRGLAASTIRTRFASVKAIFRGAVTDRMMTDNPCDGVVLPRLRRAAVALSIPTPAEVARLLAAVADPTFRVFLTLAAFAGLRRGELAGVQLGDVGFLTRTLDVRRQVQRATRGELQIRPPKYGSERTVTLPDALVAVLARQVETLAERGPDAWLLPGWSGAPLHANVIRDGMAAARAGSGVTIRLHDLRHFYASGLIAAGCDVVTVQRALGHSSAKITLDTYAHLWPSAEDRTRSAAAGLMAAVDGPADSVRTAEAVNRP